MPRPTRPLPRVGQEVRILHFGGLRERATIVALEDDGRRLRVRSESGELAEFALSPATARWVAATGKHGPRLELAPPP
jgi:hypothetical protein